MLDQLLNLLLAFGVDVLLHRNALGVAELSVEIRRVKAVLCRDFLETLAFSPTILDILYRSRDSDFGSHGIPLCLRAIVRVGSST